MREVQIGILCEKLNAANHHKAAFKIERSKFQLI